MVKLTINNKQIEVKQGSTILEAAEKSGISIPTMCWMKNLQPSTSCMVCLVQDKTSDKFLPACSAKVAEGMNIETKNSQVYEMRKAALELLLSEHSGDCEAVCQAVCPAGMDIPKMNRLIATNKMKEAIINVKETIALPTILGYICPAPCEKACRRKDIDQPIAICELKRFVAETDLNNKTTYKPNLQKSKNKSIAIVGAGPTGLSAAYYLAIMGYKCHIFDENELAGGKIRYGTDKKLLPESILDKEIEQIKNLGVVFHNNQKIEAEQIDDELAQKYNAVILALGYQEKNYYQAIVKDAFEINSNIKKNTKNVFFQRPSVKQSKMAVRAVGIGCEFAKYVNQYLKNNQIQLVKKRFNSNYNKIKEAEINEFLKESLNHQKRTEYEIQVGGFTLKQAIEEAKRCMHCDCRKKEDCKLRILADDYQAKQKKIKNTVKVEKQFRDNLIVYEPTKCIKCGICIQITEKQSNKIGFTFIGRGFNVKIDFPLNTKMEQIMENAAKECAEKCPTGAISMI